jgi:DNA-binding transcriptional regulator YiaG
MNVSVKEKMRPSTKVLVLAFRHLREALGKGNQAKTQADMAELLGISLGGWQQWEYGTRRPRGAALKALLDIAPTEELKKEIRAAVDNQGDTQTDSKLELKRMVTFKEILERVQFRIGEMKAGDKAAERELIHLWEVLARGLDIARLPDSLKGRRAAMIKEFLREIQNLGP